MTNQLPRLACLCPTYKRPNCLANAAACYVQQTYPAHLSRLFVLDDASQHADSPVSDDGIRCIVQSSRYTTLPAKFAALIDIATAEWNPDAFVIWEDDDVFLPWHLQSISDAIMSGGEYLTSRTVHSTYEQPMGGTVLEGADGRFHSSWAFTVDLLKRIGGYPNTARLDFDQQLGSALKAEAGTAHHYSYPRGPQPSYVYRWGNGIYHGSQRGEEGFQSLWDELSQLPAPYVGALVPKMDRETTLIHKVLQCDGLTV